MNYINKYTNISLLGAAGKMGSGIMALLAFEVGKLKIGAKREENFIINAIDVSPKALEGLLKYLKSQLLKYGEKNIVELREWYKNNASLVDNEEVINAYATDVMAMIKTSTRIETAYDSQLVFEAIKEDKALKVKLFSQIKQNNPDAWFLSNTSSIPLGEIDTEAGLNGDIVGFHFYNPPVIQKLLELIPVENINSDLLKLSEELAKSMRKVVVYSSDVAGFIGNGHFMRDALFALDQANGMTKDIKLADAIYRVDTVSRDLLLRPMGIYQLMDYVGVDVMCFILKSMQAAFPQEKLSHEILNKYIELGVTGGQYSDGSQKDGFFKYVKGKIVAVYNMDAKAYKDIEEVKIANADYFAPQPSVILDWKTVIREREREAMLAPFFKELKTLNSSAAKLAVAYGLKSKAIGQLLVDGGVAADTKAVNKVMETGFYHSYGPVNNYFE
ncbi:3-hydroxyacyl-CoA dehydrogenase family protein [Ancylomarina sp. 16SWW S1-10-2]|uniref:3-hydroxyacyl-CoA dehydrogenase family protein n=1 Tax=Ancylomarina sp. 16SWW S1-10-2 TaxID=2499681 RepID=UPI0012ADE793|nr:3-hydroxyacyl-CoA dehydrogenase family protein [Ancylomarina sp. 16SWW S1-10-2]MRT94135.1 3-hydroxyacyl-CoA dehydrogenase family protein [Ancylomarina sp. 16SWW S1-10-2]